MTPEQRMAVQYLCQCRFLPGSYEKRFVQNMANRTEPLSDKQAAFLLKLTWHYRGQLLRQGFPRYQVAAAGVALGRLPIELMTVTQERLPGL